jgi:hypothetical protein
MAGSPAAEWVALLLEHASALRKAGVAEIVAGECRVSLLPPEQATDKGAGHHAAQDQVHPDPLFDSTTFHGGAIPKVEFIDEENPFDEVST